MYVGKLRWFLFTLVMAVVNQSRKFALILETHVLWGHHKDTPGVIATRALSSALLC